MRKRKSLTADVETASKVKEKAVKAVADTRVIIADDHRQSAINLKKSDWALLRRVADARLDMGSVNGRSSVSKVVAWLIEESRAKLKKEAESYKLE